MAMYWTNLKQIYFMSVCRLFNNWQDDALQYYIAYGGKGRRIINITQCPSIPKYFVIRMSGDYGEEYIDRYVYGWDSVAVSLSLEAFSEEFLKCHTKK